MGKLILTGKTPPNANLTDQDWLMAGAVVVNVCKDGKTVIMVKNEFAALVDLEQLDNLAAAVKQTIIAVAERCKRPVIQLATELPSTPNFQ